MMSSRILLYFVALLFLPLSANANTGVPMIFVTMPAMLVGLVPIIIIEGYVLKKCLNIRAKKAFLSSFLANLFSTLIGVPISWLLLVILMLLSGPENSANLMTITDKFLSVTLYAAWLKPGRDLYWMIPTALLVLLIPFFFVSWISEYFIIKKLNRGIDPGLIKRACLKGNLITYSLFAIYPLMMFENPHLISFMGPKMDYLIIQFMKLLLLFN